MALGPWGGLHTREKPYSPRVLGLKVSFLDMEETYNGEVERNDIG